MPLDKVVGDACLLRPWVSRLKLSQNASVRTRAGRLFAPVRCGLHLTHRLDVPDIHRSHPQHSRRTRSDGARHHRADGESTADGFPQTPSRSLNPGRCPTSITGGASNAADSSLRFGQTAKSVHSPSKTRMARRWHAGIIPVVQQLHGFTLRCSSCGALDVLFPFLDGGTPPRRPRSSAALLTVSCWPGYNVPQQE